MSTEQSEEPVDITQQATIPTPTTAPHLKNPKRVAAGKLVAERTRQAREQQKKALADAEAKIANNAAPPEPAPEPAPEPGHEPAHEPATAPKERGLSTTQWLMVASIVVGLAGIYYKREGLKAAHGKIKGAFTKKTPEPAPEPAPEPGPSRLRKMN